jgi:translocator protein
MKKFYFLIASLLTIGVNALAVLLPLNGLTTKTISDTLKTIITPSGSTFAIWSVIYTGLIVIGIASATNKIRLSDKALNLYWLSSLVNIGWIFMWHYTITIFPAILLVLLLILNVAIMYELNSWPRHLYLIYTSWSVLASTINLTILFQYDLGLGKFLLWDPQVVGVLLLSVASIVYVGMSYKFKSIVPFCVGIWAYWGIYTEQKGDIIRFGTAVQIFVLIGLLAAGLYRFYIDYKNDQPI